MDSADALEKTKWPPKKRLWKAILRLKTGGAWDEVAWKIIGTGFQNIVPEDEDEGVPQSGTGVPKSSFSENLLRNILDLEPGQQVELCGYLAKGEKAGGISKGKFKTLASAYRARNEMRLQGFCLWITQFSASLCSDRNPQRKTPL